jgi:hypothetical protein
VKEMKKEKLGGDAFDVRRSTFNVRHPRFAEIVGAPNCC